MTTIPKASLPLAEVIARSDIIILCVPHSAYKDLKLTGKIVVDIWNFWGQQQCITAIV